ncbi:hypothetical protein VTL71DRAFT_16379 [Oculimacula yallundae]|uniref:NACHT domain-containing protein n=1 Tax=Oculimacula yallundae TaxID=86028 RepID=A0ABR4CGD0_9HELO
MLLDPLTALSLAGTVVQFVDFTTKVLAKGAEIHRSLDGTLTENREVESITKDLLSLNKRLVTSIRRNGDGSVGTKPSNKQLSLDEQALESIADACSDIARELLAQLEPLKLQGERKRWKSLYKVLKSAWGKKEIDDLLERLDRYRDELELHLLVSIKSQIDVKACNEAAIFDKLDRSAQLMITYMADNQNTVATQFKMQEQIISRHQETSLMRMDEQHEKTRAELRATMERLGDKGSLWSTERLFEDQAGNIDWWKLSPAAKIQAKDIRNTLWLSSIDDRFDEITEAHVRTFGWIYQEPRSETRKWSSFDKWLREGDGAYWISGKPGSGKSTLMKFLYKDDRTEEALKEWGGEREVVTASFYFWNSGINFQKTEESMLRSLLFRAMRKKEELIPVVLKDYLTPATYRKLKLGTLRWSLAQLKQLFTVLVQQEVIEINLMFIVDGLDEFLKEIFKASLSLSSPRVKFVFSSRPWNVFLDVFEDMPQLRLQDLTHVDISAYVNDHLNGNKRMKQLSLKSPEQAEELVDEIVSKASGVFLWVRIVVASLLDGLMNRDKISDLQARLNLLPDDLDALYKHILSRPNSHYHLRRSQYILMRQAYDEPPLTLAFSFADEDDQDFYLKSDIKILTKGEAMDRCEEMVRRLEASCAGLLEVDYRANPDLPLLERDRVLSNHDYYRSAYGSKIQFMHRTVKDFFANKERIDEICAVVKGTSWDPHAALLRSWILRLKILPSHFMGITMSTGGYGCVETLVEQAQSFARSAEENSGVSQKELLKELERTVSALHAPSKLGSAGWAPKQPPKEPPIGTEAQDSGALNTESAGPEDGQINSPITVEIGLSQNEIDEVHELLRTDRETALNDTNSAPLKKSRIRTPDNSEKHSGARRRRWFCM